jgi:hypothetical protein
MQAKKGRVRPYAWALRQLRVARAHRVTRGAKEVIVAVVDLGYRHHPDLDGHLWRGPGARGGGLHGWDFVDDDASLEHSGPGAETSAYYRGHHAFVAGEVAAVAPACPIMIVRVGYGRPDSWWRGIRYAADRGARVLVIPHGYIAGEAATGTPRFYQGTDFSYPDDNPQLREAIDYAHDRGCLIVRGTADNRGRRVATAMAGLEAVFAVGSTNRRDEPADICCSADYVAAGAPGGQRGSGMARDQIWGCGGDGEYIPFTGGCMASGFAGGVAALVWSRFPHLTGDQLRQVLQNTARPARGVEPDADGWESRLGYGILDASRAVSLDPDRLCRDVRLRPSSVSLLRRQGRRLLAARLKNRGAFDAGRALVVAYDGDPTKPSDPRGSMRAPATPLQTRQLGHAIIRVRGLHEAAVAIELEKTPGRGIWFETFCLDRRDAGRVHRARIRLQGR